MISPTVELIDRVLRARTPAGELAADWRGEMPKFSNRWFNTQLREGK
jgi:hypothetical protein